MKPLKPVIAIVTAALVAAFTLGATTGKEVRPPNVPSERWLPIAPNAGFVLSVDLAGPVLPKERPAPVRRRPDEVAEAAFYVKTPHGWMRTRIENPTYLAPVVK
jgi:hypothetical protein